MAQLTGPVNADLVMLTMGDRQVTHVTKPAIGMETHTKPDQSSVTVNIGGSERSPSATARGFAGDEFRRVRRMAHRTQAHVAEALGCDRRLVGRWEQSKEAPSFTALAELERIYAQFQQEVAEAEAGPRHCSSCRRTLPVFSFAVDRSRTSGRQSQCRDCKSDAAAHWRKQNAEQILKQRRDKQTRQRVHPSGRAAKPRVSRDFLALNELGEDLRVVKSPPRETISNPSQSPSAKLDLEREANHILRDEPTESHETLRERRERHFNRQTVKAYKAGRISEQTACAFARLADRYVHSPSWLHAGSKSN